MLTETFQALDPASFDKAPGKKSPQGGIGVSISDDAARPPVGPVQAPR